MWATTTGSRSVGERSTMRVKFLPIDTVVLTSQSHIVHVDVQCRQDLVGIPLWIEEYLPGGKYGAYLLDRYGLGEEHHGPILPIIKKSEKR